MRRPDPFYTGFPSPCRGHVPMNVEAMAHYFVTPEQIALADKNLPAAARIYSRLQTVLASPDSALLVERIGRL